MMKRDDDLGGVAWKTASRSRNDYEFLEERRFSMKKKKVQTAEDQKNRDRQTRARAVKWLLTHEREERYLISFSIEYSEFEKSFEWLRSAEARSEQKFYDFQIFFESLKAKMCEFRWSKELLMAHGIDFAKAKKQYFAMV